MSAVVPVAFAEIAKFRFSLAPHLCSCSGTGQRIMPSIQSSLALGDVDSMAMCDTVVVWALAAFAKALESQRFPLSEIRLARGPQRIWSASASATRTGRVTLGCEPASALSRPTTRIATLPFIVAVRRGCGPRPLHWPRSIVTSACTDRPHFAEF